MQTYVSLRDSDTLAHLQRHFAGSATVGSEFFPTAQDLVLDRAEALLRDRFDQAQAAGTPAGRVVEQLQFDAPVGTDALVDLATQTGEQLRVIRDQGTPAESIVTAVTSDAIPTTDIVTVIAGPYGPSGGWGLYTLFPGVEAPAFPNARQPDAVRQESEAYWRTHGFLATAAEIRAHPRADGQPHAPAPNTPTRNAASRSTLANG